MKTYEQLKALYGTGEYLSKKYLSVGNQLLDIIGDSEAKDLLQLAAYRERELDTLQTKKHPVYEFATLNWSYWEYPAGGSDVIITTTFAVWEPGDNPGSVDASYSSIQDYEMALCKASLEGWRICSETRTVSESTESLFYKWNLQREKL